MANEFSGDDRRAVEKMRDLLAWVARRDQKARNPQKTAALSSRVEIFPNENTTYQHAVQVLDRRLEDCVEAEKNVAMVEETMGDGIRAALVAGANTFIAALKGAKTKSTTVIVVDSVDEYACHFELSSTDPAYAGETYLMYYPWNFVTVTPMTFDVIAVEVVPAPNMGHFFNP